MIDIEKLNKAQEKRIKRLKAGKNDPFEEYEKRLEGKERFEIVFSMSDAEGNLYSLDENGIELMLPASSLQESDRYYSAYRRGEYVGIHTLEVMVSGIDRDKRTVTLKSGHTTKAIIAGVREALDTYLADRYRRKKENLEAPEPLYIYGTIAGVDIERTTAFVRILNQNIPGIITIAEWTDSFIPYFPEGIENKGIPVRFKLLGKTNHDGRKVYRLSTRGMVNEVWENIPKALLEKKGVVMAMCIDNKDPKKWWAKVDGIEVPLLGHYTNKFKITVGKRYTCTIRRTDTEKHNIVLVPFKEIGKALSDEDTVISKDDFEEAMKIAKKKSDKKED